MEELKTTITSEMNIHNAKRNLIDDENGLP